MNALYPLSADTDASIDAIGGKAFSLVRLAQHGFSVPSGWILATHFFQPWYERLRCDPLWPDLVSAPPTRWPNLCQTLQQIAASLPFDSSQQQTLDRLRQQLPQTAPALLFAVRSSSPDEDLASASFAGGYESILGVPLHSLESAIRACFLSSLDHRVFAYKRHHGFDIAHPRIAVIVQAQIDSEVAGVAFSINPLTNDFDEALVEANWGLGDTVVSGLASPDRFAIDKHTGNLLATTIGAKQLVHKLDTKAGGAHAISSQRPHEPSIDAPRLRELTAALLRIEQLFACPIDIEWAFVGPQLHLLQARPITAFVPLPPEMLTPPGARRRLYADIALSSGLTINAPISSLGIQWMQQTLHAMFRPFIGDFQLSLDPRRRLWFFAGHRMYQDLSNILWIASPKSIGKGLRESDALMAETLLSLDRATYRSPRRPAWLGLSLCLKLPRLAWHCGKLLCRSLSAILFPTRAAALLHRDVAAFPQTIQTELDPTLPLDRFRQQVSKLLAQRIFADLFSALIAYILAHSVLPTLAGKKSPQRRDLAQRMLLGFQGNVVADMGIALYDLSQLLPPSDWLDLPQLRARLDARQLPPSFLDAWDAFLERFGHRGPLEMDLARPRYADDPSIALAQIALMAAAGPTANPHATQQIRIRERREAFAELTRVSGWLRRKLLHRAHTLLDLFGGARDTPKHQALLAYQAVRSRILRDGQSLHCAGRLDTAEQVFDLDFADLHAADLDPSLDLRALLRQRLAFKQTLERQVTNFPGLIDSRGRILRPPPRPETPGELRGTPISNGVARGPVKVLHFPDEKPVLPGDILVAYTTDPGWTPLFVNAAAIVLEIGGVLQHGAVVAREYGKPCVAGIDRATSLLQDGQPIEVNGTQGTIHLLSPQ